MAMAKGANRREPYRNAAAAIPRAPRDIIMQPSIDRPHVGQLKAQGLGATAIAKQLGCSRASVYRVMAE